MSDEEKEKNAYVKDITNKIEKIPSLEKKFGVKITRVFARIEKGPFGGEYTIDIFGELRPSNGVIKPDMLEIVSDAIDHDGRIIGRDSTFGFENIEDFESFDLSISAPELPSRIRLYPSEF